MGCKILFVFLALALPTSDLAAKGKGHVHGEGLLRRVKVLTVDPRSIKEGLCNLPMLPFSDRWRCRIH